MKMGSPYGWKSTVTATNMKYKDYRFPWDVSQKLGLKQESVRRMELRTLSKKSLEVYPKSYSGSVKMYGFDELLYFVPVDVGDVLDFVILEENKYFISVGVSNLSRRLCLDVGDSDVAMFSDSVFFIGNKDKVHIVCKKCVGGRCSCRGVMNGDSSLAGVNFGFLDDDIRKECPVCFEPCLGGVYNPCGHLGGCLSCMNLVKSTRGNCCKCSCPIESVIRVWLA